jgi:hypothetical protein
MLPRLLLQAERHRLSMHLDRQEDERECRGEQIAEASSHRPAPND